MRFSNVQWRPRSMAGMLSVLLMSLALAPARSANAQPTRTTKAATPSPAEMLARVDRDLNRVRQLNAQGDHQRAVQLLKAGQFSEAEQLFKRREKEWADDPVMAISFDNLLYATDVRDPGYLDVLDRWVAERPSYLSFTVRGNQRLARGYELRGTASISETTERSLLLMQVMHRNAVSDFREAIALKPDFAAPYTGIVSAMKANDGSSLDMLGVLGQITQKRPYNFSTREAYLFALTPRWGGSIEQMQGFVESLDPYVRGNSQLWLLRGYVYKEIGNILLQQKTETSAQQALDAFNEALSFGTSVQFLYGRGWAHTQLKMYDAAMVDFDRCLALVPRYSECESARQTLQRWLISRPQGK